MTKADLLLKQLELLKEVDFLAEKLTQKERKNNEKATKNS